MVHIFSKNKKLLAIVMAVMMFVAVLMPQATLAQTQYEMDQIDYVEPGTATGSFGNAIGDVRSATQATCREDINTIGYTICKIGNLINSLVPVLLALGVVYFVFGVVQYVIGGGEEAKTQGRDRMIWGIVGFAVIVGMWGLVNIVANTFNLKNTAAVIPTLVPTSTSAVGGDCDLGPAPKLQDVLKYGTCFIQNAIIPFLFALAIAFFIWGIIQFVILGAGDETKRTQGRQHMIWGVVALAVMLGVWGLVKIVGGTLGLNTSVLPQVKPIK